MTDDTLEQAAKTVNAVKCRHCGANLKFAPGSQSLTCEHCGTENLIEQRRVEIVENDFLGFLERNADAERQDILTVKCESCGASTTLAPNVTAANCPYCDAPQVVKNTATQKIIKPKYVLPFRVARSEAKEGFVKWVGGLWFAPNQLKDHARHNVQRLSGVYMPYWTYDTNTLSSYTGMRGEYYYVNETYRDAQGQSRTRRVRKTAWYPASGTVYNDFDDVLICASHALPQDIVNDLEPWDLAELVAYDDKYLAGFVTESYQTPLQEGFAQAKERMKPVIEDTVRRDIGGDEQVIHGLSTSYRDITFKHILLPLWISAYRYRGDVYRFLVNARTGEVRGQRPYSGWKIFFFTVTVLAVLAGAYYLKKG